MPPNHYDWIIVGSGFGGAVAALRLAERGARVLVLEKGKRYRPHDFAETNWELGRWLWEPALGLKGIFRMSPLEHATVLHGVGVGGGSLGYANTLPVPPRAFFEARSFPSRFNFPASSAVIAIVLDCDSIMFSNRVIYSSGGQNFSNENVPAISG